MQKQTKNNKKTFAAKLYLRNINTELFILFCHSYWASYQASPHLIVYWFRFSVKSSEGFSVRRFDKKIALEPQKNLIKNDWLAKQKIKFFWDQILFNVLCLEQEINQRIISKWANYFLGSIILAPENEN